MIRPSQINNDIVLACDAALLHPLQELFAGDGGRGGAGGGERCVPGVGHFILSSFFLSFFLFIFFFIWCCIIVFLLFMGELLLELELVGSDSGEKMGGEEGQWGWLDSSVLYPYKHRAFIVLPLDLTWQLNK